MVMQYTSATLLQAACSHLSWMHCSVLAAVYWIYVVLATVHWTVFFLFIKREIVIVLYISTRVNHVNVQQLHIMVLCFQFYVMWRLVFAEPGFICSLGILHYTYIKICCDYDIYGYHASFSLIASTSIKARRPYKVYIDSWRWSWTWAGVFCSRSIQGKLMHSDNLNIWLEVGILHKSRKIWSWEIRTSTRHLWKTCSCQL